MTLPASYPGSHRLRHFKALVELAQASREVWSSQTFAMCVFDGGAKTVQIAGGVAMTAFLLLWAMLHCRIMGGELVQLSKGSRCLNASIILLESGDVAANDRLSVTSPATNFRECRFETSAVLSICQLCWSFSHLGISPCWLRWLLSNSFFSSLSQHVVGVWRRETQHHTLPC